MSQLSQFLFQLLQLIQLVTDMCKGAVARHGNPVFASETETSKNSFGAKMCKKIKLEKRTLYFGKWYRLTLITLSKCFMLNSFFLKIFTFNINKPCLRYDILFFFK